MSPESHMTFQDKEHAETSAVITMFHHKMETKDHRKDPNKLKTPLLCQEEHNIIIIVASLL